MHLRRNKNISLAHLGVTNSVLFKVSLREMEHWCVKFFLYKNSAEEGFGLWGNFLAKSNSSIDVKPKMFFTSKATNLNLKHRPTSEYLKPCLTSGMALGVAMLVQTEIPQQLLDGLPLNFVQHQHPWSPVDKYWWVWWSLLFSPLTPPWGWHFCFLVTEKYNPTPSKFKYLSFTEPRAA